MIWSDFSNGWKVSEGLGFRVGLCFGQKKQKYIHGEKQLFEEPHKLYGAQLAKALRHSTSLSSLWYYIFISSAQIRSRSVSRQDDFNCQMIFLFYLEKKNVGDIVFI